MYIKPIDAFVKPHEAWLNKRLYDLRDSQGDVEFVFTVGGKADDLVIPEPESEDGSAKKDVEMKDEQVVTLKCHS